MKTRIYVGIFFLLSFGVIDLYGQRDNVEEGNIGLGGQIAYNRSGDTDAGRFMFGVLLRSKLSFALGVDASINYREEKINNGQVTLRSWPLQLSVLFYPFPQFYAIAGGGWYHTTVDYTPGLQHEDLADQTYNPFGWHLGGGAEVPLAENVRLFGDVRFVYLDYNFRDFGNVPLNNINSNFYMINLGIIFGFR
jgi:opacity protein-like surface antigen